MESAKHIEFLKDEYLRRRSKNSSYSLRAFAKHLDLAPSRLCQLLNGKRAITAKQIEKIAISLKLPPPKVQFLRDHGIGAKLKKNGSSLPKYSKVDLDEFKFIADWYHSAILCLIRTSGFRADAKYIAKKLGISTVEVNGALARLEGLKLISRKSGVVTLLEENIAIGSDVASPALRKLHGQMLEKARQSLEEVDLSLRDISSVTMAIDPSMLPQAKQLITTFRRQLCHYLEQGNAKSVYAFNMQLFPLSKDKDTL